MKKLLTVFIVFTMAVTAAGCGADSAAYLMPYTAGSSDDQLDPTSVLSADAADGFAANLGVVSVSDSTSSAAKSSVSGIDATEVFLAGTTDNKVLAAYNIYKTMPPASLTKILTALVALKSNTDLDKEYTLTDDVTVSVADAQVCGFKSGDVVTLRTLLYCMLIYSGNDAANAVASAVSGGDISSFCSEMNKEAKSLGATQTNFVTPNGLDDPNHYTTAYDLYLIFKECLKYDVFKDAISKSGYTASFTRSGKKVTQYYASTDYYLLGTKSAPSGIKVVGGKTGTTDQAGLCLILYVTDSKGKGYISVLLGSADKNSLYSSMNNLLSDINK